MRPLLEVIALGARDARPAEDGGADRLELVGTMADDGLSPEPATVEAVVRASSLPVRPMLRFRSGFAADAGERASLKDLLSAFTDAGADGVVLGFLDADAAVDISAVHDVVGGSGLPWTFHRALDHAADQGLAWDSLRSLSGLDQVLTAGDPDGVRFGLGSLLERAGADPFARERMMVGGGLAPAHVRPLRCAGVRAFHVGSGARPGGSFAAPVSAPLVAEWRQLLDVAVD